MPRILDTINSPCDLKELSDEKLEVLAAEIRRELIDTISKTGGHLGPNLGVVELTLGIHKALNCPEDVVAFDVGHQSYVHKLITGRANDFSGVRCYQGPSGFPNRKESEFDLFGSGHASDSLSIALGYALARDANGADGEVLALIGDGSLTGGMAWEALMHIGHTQTRMIIVINDNEMSITKNVGALSLYLGRIRLDKRYWGTRETVFSQVRKRGSIGEKLVDAGKTVRESFKQLVVPGMLFEELGLRYMGPIDGHDIKQVSRAIELAKGADGPVIIHAVTRKGQGYQPAIERPDAFHGIAPFDIATGKPHPSKGNSNYTKIFSEALLREAAENEDIHAITAAMAPGTGLDAFAAKYPERFHDVGIAEGHAVGLAAGLAFGGKTPVVAIYSTFLQRAYDQIIGDVALQDAHVVFALDRGGFVGDDGPTHHGLYDLTYLRSVPEMKILAPSNEDELSDALHTALNLSGPVALRYPRGAGVGVALKEKPELLGVGKSKELREGSDVAILAVGRLVEASMKAAELLNEQGISARVIDMRWVKPVDAEAIARAAAECKLIVSAEENIIRGGFGAAVAESLSEQGLSTTPLLICATPDEFACHGTMDLLLELAGLDAKSLARRITERLKSLG